MLILKDMEEIVKGSSYDTVRGTKIVGVKDTSLFIPNSGNLYLYNSESQIIPKEKYSDKCICITHVKLGNTLTI